MKKQRKFTEYKCRVSWWQPDNIAIPLRKCVPEADKLHMTSCIIWNTYDGKFYYPDEMMPYPEKRYLRPAKNFCADAMVQPEKDKDGFLGEFHEEDDFNFVLGILYFD